MPKSTTVVAFKLHDYTKEVALQNVLGMSTVDNAGKPSKDPKFPNGFTLEEYRTGIKVNLNGPRPRTFVLPWAQVASYEIREEE